MAIDKINNMPIGTIMLWTKTSSIISGIKGIPDGWYVCSGQTVNGVTLPNMSDRFIKGTSSINESEKIGGSNEITLGERNIPDISDRFGLFPNGYMFDPNASGNGWANGGDKNSPQTKPSINCSVFIKYGKIGENHSIESENGKKRQNRFFKSEYGGAVSMDNFCKSFDIVPSNKSSMTVTPINVEPIYYTALYIIKCE